MSSVSHLPRQTTISTLEVLEHKSLHCFIIDFATQGPKQSRDPDAPWTLLLSGLLHQIKLFSVSVYPQPILYSPRMFECP
jgi:hypothetical protein